MNPARAAPPPAGVRGNDWRAAEPPGPFVPRQGVSVVLPCHGAQRALDAALAALGRQAYPPGLLEAVVVDDGSEPPLAAPRGPLDVRLVRQPRRGLAAARNAGARAARHAILVFLDADLLARESLVEAHARWHHAVADALTLGFCAYADPAGLDAGTVRRHPGPLAGLFRERACDAPWTERHMARTGDLTVPRDDLFRAVSGGNLGIRRECFEALGGLSDGSFGRYGWEDTEFGYRAQTRGLLLVPVRAAVAWHLGRFAPNRDVAKRRAVAAHSTAAAERIAHPAFRPSAGGPYAVPRTAVTVHAEGHRALAAADTVARLLAGDDGDLAVRVETGGCRRTAAALRERFRIYPNVHVDAPAGSLDAFPATPYHVALPAGAAFGPGLLARLRGGLGRAAAGEAVLPDGARATVARAWALHRARRCGGGAADYGVAVAFAVRDGRRGAGRPLRALGRRLLPVAPRPLGGFARVAAEVAGVGSAADVRRVAAWLLVGLRWAVAARLGHRRRLVRPRQLVRLGLYRCAGGRPSDLAAGLRLALRALGPAARAQAATARALAAGDVAASAAMAGTLVRRPDLKAEKIVSRRYRFVWIANPKVASRSLIRALTAADPSAVLVREATLAEVYAAFPEARGYVSFAFVRHPVDRAASCHADKIAGAGIVEVGLWPGLGSDVGVDAFCAWLDGPWGADAFADRHWLSQDVLLREAPGAPLPDVVGRFEHLAEDFAAVAAQLGLPPAPLPHLNVGGGRRRVSGSARAALARRYAADFALGGYAMDPDGRGARCAGGAGGIDAGPGGRAP